MADARFMQTRALVAVKEPAVELPRASRAAQVLSRFGSDATPARLARFLIYIFAEYTSLWNKQSCGILSSGMSLSDHPANGTSVLTKSL
jgi:hypothetical protein